MLRIPGSPKSLCDGLTRRDATLQFTLARDEGLEEATDPAMLEWAAAHGLLLLTHDRRTMPAFAFERVASGLAMLGVFIVDNEMPVGKAIEELLIAAHCLSPEECRNVVMYFPLR